MSRNRFDCDAAGAPMRAFCVALLLGGLTAASAYAQSPQVAEPPVTMYGVVSREASSTEGAAAADQAAPVGPPRSTKRGELVFAPIPMINPTLENGLFVMTGYLYRFNLADRTTPPSTSAIAGFKTSNGSWGGAVLQSLHVAHDRFRVLGVFAYSDINYNFYGIGQESGESSVSIELNQGGPTGFLDGLVRVAPGWYVGARYQMTKMTVTTSDIAVPGGPTLPAADADLRTAALGPRLEFDSRDNPFYPRRGSQLQVIASFFDETFGGRRTYQMYQAWVNGYHEVAPHQIVAWHLGACGVDGAVPFYDLCLLGKNQDLRGYPVGQYRDRALLAAQAEWRSEIWWRFGAAAFVGAGEVVNDYRKFTWRDALPGGGVGLRFTLARRNHVNLRVDYAWGKNSTALYVGVAEAF